MTPAQGRWCVLIAAILWSTSGAFAKALTQDTVFGLNVPAIETRQWGEHAVPVQIACYRVLFAALVLVPTLRKSDIVFRWPMIGAAVSFAIMNFTFISAMALGTSANAILLQYSAPVWVYFASVLWLGERSDRRSTIATWLGTLGICVIVAGGWQSGELPVIFIALLSGAMYASVLVHLRILRGVSPRWLTVWNHGLSALVVAPLLIGLRPPTLIQFVTLFVYGALQMSLAYWLVAKAVQVVTPQEAGTISLLEPILNPVWAYLVSPDTEAPGLSTWIGGSIILAALAWRYWPRRSVTPAASTS